MRKSKHTEPNIDPDWKFKLRMYKIVQPFEALLFLNPRNNPLNALDFLLIRNVLPGPVLDKDLLDLLIRPTDLRPQ